MPPKQKQSGGNAATAEAEIQSVTAGSTANTRPAYIDGAPVTPEGEIIQADNGAQASAEENDGPEGQGKNWGPPYKAIVSSAAKGFEMGENRRFKQRVFIFKDKPAPEVLAALKDNGFTYRPAEKAWTIPANAATRELSDQLARQFGGESPEISR
jgi:hypothetical protein